MSKFRNFAAGIGGATALTLVLAVNFGDRFVTPLPDLPEREVVIAPAPVADAVMAANADTAAEGANFGLGRPALPEEVAAWDIDVRPDGLGLPEGRGDIFTGEELYIAQCASCHGDFGEAIDRWPVLAGGQGSLTDDRPTKTVGSYWPYLSTVWDYVNRAMPFGNAQSLSPDEVYAITAYILYLNDIVDDDFELSHENFAEVRLPNEENFYLDDRAEMELAAFSTEPCMENCKEAVEITARAAVIDVTPEESASEEAMAEAAPAEEMAAEEIVEATATEAAPAEEAASAGPDPELVAAGERAFRQCSACHQVGDGAVSRTGPHLNGVFGRTAGSLDGFRYSPAFTEAGEGGLVWDAESLHDFLMQPRDYISGTRMAFGGFRNDSDIDAVIAYLQSYSE